MQTWFRKNLGDPLLAGPMLDRIQTLFAAEYTALMQPTDMALFIRHEATGDLHCDAVIYFSPAAATIASEIAAAPCPQPSKQDLGLLAGSDEAWSVLFAES
jgi:hypothetical protein